MIYTRARVNTLTLAHVPTVHGTLGYSTRLGRARDLIALYLNLKALVTPVLSA